MRQTKVKKLRKKFKEAGGGTKGDWRHFKKINK